MVTREPPRESAPTNANSVPTITVQDPWSSTDSRADAGNIWGNSDPRQHPQNGANQTANGPHPQDIPAPLRPGQPPRSPFDTEDDNPWGEVRKDAEKPKITLEHTPTVLRPGGKLETNPFKRKPITGNSSPKNDAVPATHPDVPTQAFSQLEVADQEQSANPWKPVVDEPRAAFDRPPIPSSARDQTPESDIWATAPTGTSSTGQSFSTPTPVSLPSREESPAWDEVDRVKPSLGPMPQRLTEDHEFSQDVHAWDDVEALGKGKRPAVAHSGQNNPQEGWNLIDHDPIPDPPSLSRQSTWENFEEEKDQPDQTQPEGTQVPATANVETVTSEAPPALPPRQTLDASPPPQQPPRPHTPSAANKTETYQIKNINWFDAKTSPNPRKSPILVQNANGPCPLVALVNALSLTTPANLPNTVLVETLRSREQISLNLLLEAVFDELMSPRRTQPDAALPDVTELYAFLKSLHTGMNVNPRYVPTQELVTAHKRSSTHQHPLERGDYIPGTFENTRDMKLYATFSIPLMHGWLPPKDDPVNEALARQASSYDDTQTLMFREEELEDKLSNSSAGLSEQDQQIYQDILTIRSWLNSSATQLTKWGLEVITKAIQPGTFAILFRNDHFSTLYRHPQTSQLFTLVTDAGYYSHDEIVWESLVDVNGERAEFFSGDFRLVGGPQQGQTQDIPGAWYTDDESTAQGSEWQTAQNRRGRNNANQTDSPRSPAAANHEQEDRDLALALQLQEEEDERHREEQAARRRESQLSEQYLEQQGRGSTARTGPIRSQGGSTRSLVPARGSSMSVNSPSRGGANAHGGRPVQQVRSLVPPATATTHRPANAEEDDAPPSYDQASRSEPYIPPSGHPNHPSSSPSSASSARRRPTLGSVPSQPPPAQAGPSHPVGMGRGRPMMSSHQHSASAGRDKDCVVM